MPQGRAADRRRFGTVIASVPGMGWSVAIGVAGTVAVAAVKISTFGDPPAWDAAMGLYPAAITLVETGFDYPSLLDRGGFASGGPNVHALSLYTLLVALLMSWLGPTTAYVVLHALSVLCAGVAATALWHLAAGLTVPERLAIVLAALSLPVVLTQFGLIYLEVPLLATTAAAVASATRKKTVATVVWSTIATALKPTGIIAAAVAAVVVWRQAPGGRKVREASLVAGPPALLLGAVLAFGGATGTPALDLAASAIRGSAGYLTTIPDVLVVMLAGLLVLPMARSDTDTLPMWLGPLYIAFLAAYMGSFVSGYAILPRYYSQVVPLVLLGLLAAGRRKFGPPLFWSLVAVLIAVNLANFTGRLYPDAGSENFAIAERSNEYRRLLMLHEELSTAVEELDPTIPVYFGHPEHYRQAFPELGYVGVAHPLGRFVATRDGLDLRDLPADAYLVIDIPFRGGIAIYETYEAALDSDEWTVELARFEQNGFTLAIAHLARVESASSSVTRG